VQNFGGKSDYLVDCLIAPEDIGAVCDTGDGGWHNAEGAIRSKRYYVTGGHEMVNRGMYHSSAYASLLDSEWAAYKLSVIEESKKALEKMEAVL